MAAIDNLVHETTTTTGTGDMSLTPVSGRQQFSEAFSAGGSDVFYYFISHQSAAEWEVGTGSLLSGLLSRDTVLASSNVISGVPQLVDFSAGNKDVTNGLPASVLETLVPATTSVAGIVELATATETQDRSSSSVVVTPDGLADFARIKTGTYTGDGTTSQAITGVGFQPKYVRIWPRYTADNSTDVIIAETTDTIVDDAAAGMAFITFSTALGTSNVAAADNRIIALGADGFTVDDDGADIHPNQNGITYNYLCFG